MKDCSDFEFENLPQSMPSALKCLEFCIRHLKADDKRSMTDAICGKLTFEEVCGALLMARRELKEKDSEIEYLQNEVDEFEKHNETYWRDLAKSQQVAIDILKQEHADARSSSIIMPVDTDGCTADKPA